MWIDIKGSLYNLDYYYKIIETIDECESYKHYCIYLYFKKSKNGINFTIISFEDEKKRNEAFSNLQNRLN